MAICKNIIVLFIVFLVLVTCVYCEELEEFLTEVGSFLENLQRNYYICDINGMEYDIRKLDQYIEIFAALLSVLLTVQEAPLLLTQIVSGLANSLRKRKYDISKKLSDHLKDKEQVYVCETEDTGGRPRFVVTREQIVVLRDTGMTWSDISKCLCISPKTLYRRRQEYDIPNNFSNISDSELDNLLSDVLALTPNAGETYVTGSLRARGILVQRRRIRNRINRSLAEFAQQINYHGLSSVAGRKSPLALWHESLVSSNSDVLVDNPDVYGIDYQYAADEIIEEENIVRVPDTNYHVTDATFALILQNPPPLDDDGNHGINCFSSLIVFLETNGGSVQE
eukprot:gene13267-14634_t